MIEQFTRRNWTGDDRRAYDAPLRETVSAALDGRPPRRSDLHSAYRDDRFMPRLETHQRFMDHAGQLAARR